MKWEYKDCQYGDIIRVKLGSVYHYGIFVSDNEVIAFGLPPTAENLQNQQAIKVLATDIDVFSYDLARLSKNLLKGKDLNEFVKRSFNEI